MKLPTPEISCTRISTPQPSGHLWTGVVPRDLAPGTHVIKVIRRDEYGNGAEAHKVFEACGKDFDTIENGHMQGRDCYVLTAN